MFKRQYAFAPLLVVLALLVAFAFPGVRAVASDFLAVFRVQKFAPISISPRQLAMLEQLAGQGLYPGQFEMISEPGPGQTVDSPAAAAALVGRPVRAPAALGEPQQIFVTSGGQGRLIIDLDNARAILRAVDADPRLLPDSLDGAAVEVTIFDGVAQQWPDGVNLLQTASPQINYPADVDPALLGEALLQLLGMSPGEARRLARNIDWTNTLLLPIPSDLATFGEARVDGVSGLFISSLRGEDNSLMWQKDGIVYILHGRQGVNELIRLANSLQ